MKATANDVTRALDSGGAGVRLVLLYGPDEATSQSLARRLERAMGPEAERVDLDATALKSDPARLADEAASLSLFGEKRWIRISPASEDCLIAVDALLASETAQNPVVAIAGALRGTSALLKLALAHPAAMTHISYLPDSNDAAKLASAFAQEAGLRIDRDTALAIAAACSNDRAIMAREVEKLALYCDAAPEHPATAGIEAFEAIGARTEDGQVNRLAHAVVDGRPGSVAIELARLEQAGLDAIPQLRAVHRQLMQIAALRAEADRGRSPAAVVEARGKAIFWKDKDVTIREVGRWSAAKLATAADRIAATERAIMNHGTAGQVLADAEFLNVARVAERGR